MKIKILFLFLFFLILIINISTISAYNWSSSVISPESTDDAYRACLAIDNSNSIHVAWKDKSNIIDENRDWDIFYKYKNLNSNWSKIDIVTSNSMDNVICLSMTIDNNNTIHIAYKEEKFTVSNFESDIFYIFKKNNEKWSQPELISKTSTGTTSCPTITSDEAGIIHLVWADTTPFDNYNDSDLIYTKKTINGWT